MSPDTIEKLFLIALGWLLGMVGPTITEAIRKRRENNQIKVALAAELREISYKLALVNYWINAHFGTVDRTYLQWLQSVTKNYKGPSLSETTQQAIEMQLTFSEARLAGLVQSQMPPKGKNVVAPKFVVPLLDARVSSLLYLESRLQILLLDIRSNINLLNELVDQARYYGGLTFGNLHGENYALVVSNAEDCHRQYAERAKIIVTKIDELGRLL